LCSVQMARISEEKKEIRAAPKSRCPHHHLR
jgi:hypothetical protein